MMTVRDCLRNKDDREKGESHQERKTPGYVIGALGFSVNRSDPLFTDQCGPQL